MREICLPTNEERHSHLEMAVVGLNNQCYMFMDLCFWAGTLDTK